MKKVLITGADSYVGTNVEKWLMKEPDKYYVETLDMKDPNWKDFDFSRFDVVFHVAGIAHVSTKKNMKDLYFKINRDLAKETAVKAKNEGVKQFIFMSSMIVYSSKESRITKDTIPNPDNFYGLSKLEAEKKILSMQTEKFKICVLRPPMIYGPASKGNLTKLISISKYLVFFPKYQNKRSSLYIYNLTKIIKLYIDESESGVFFPQNNEFMSTLEVVNLTRTLIGKINRNTSVLNFIIKLLNKRQGVFNKLFSDFYYDMENQSKIEYFSFRESMIETVKVETTNE